MAGTADKMISIAEAEIGYQEKASNASLDSKAANAGYNNYTKYWRDLKPTYQGQPWCDAFVSWVFRAAYGEAAAQRLLCGGLYSYYTPASAQCFADAGQLDTVPEKGAVVFFTRNGRVDGTYHTGIVKAVDSTYFYTIEGNTSSAAGIEDNGGCVAAKQYGRAAYGARAIFGHPDYNAESASGTAGNASISNGGYTHQGRDYGGVFDPLFYSSNYADLNAMFGSDAGALFRHFLDYGIAEGRVAKASFDVLAYRARQENKDLRKLFGRDYGAYVQHYIDYGKKEGRPALPEDAPLYKKVLSGTYRLKRDAALRVGPGALNPSMVLVPGGATATCYGYYGKVENAKWLYVAYGGRTGYVVKSRLERA